MLVVPLLLACAGTTKPAQTNASGANRPPSLRLPVHAVAPPPEQRFNGTTTCLPDSSGGDNNIYNSHAKPPHAGANKPPADHLSQGQTAKSNPATQTAQKPCNVTLQRHASFTQMDTKIAGALRTVGGANAVPNRTVPHAPGPPKLSAKDPPRGEMGMIQTTWIAGNTRHIPFVRIAMAAS